MLAKGLAVTYSQSVAHSLTSAMPVVASNPMPALFKRLRKIGFDEAFLRTAVLPDWWNDDLAESPVTRSQIEMRVARRLGLPLADIADPSKTLQMPPAAGVRLKRAKASSTLADITPGLTVARNAVRQLVPCLRDMKLLPAYLTPEQLRTWIQGRQKVVDLAGLVEACWAHGIAVFHFAPLPEHAKRFAGVAYFEGTTPIIILASGWDSPPRLAYYLAHEIGHVLCGHVKPGGDVLADEDIDGGNADPQEREADDAAMILLTGHKTVELKPVSGLTAVKFCYSARELQAKTNVHAGTLVLIYGKTASRMPLAISALKLMNLDTGGRAIIAEALQRHLLSVAQEGDHPLADIPGPVLELLHLFGINSAGD